MTRPERAVVEDPFEPGAPIPLDGVAAGLGPVWTAVAALLAALAGYMLVGNLAALLLMAMRGVPIETVLADLPAVLERHGDLLLGGNAIGLVLGLGVLSLVLARLHSSRPLAYLRLRRANVSGVVLATVGLFSILPFVHWTASLNELLPLPRLLRDLEQGQMALLEQVLSGEGNMLWLLLVIAAVPALCEEVFFRGFVQRNLERGLGMVTGIVVTGVAFGFFHLRFSQAVPLVLIGIYLAYLAWQTGSVWIPVLIHLVNNAAMVLLATQTGGEGMLSDFESGAVPWYLIPTGLIIFAACMYALRLRSGQTMRNRSTSPVEAG